MPRKSKTPIEEKLKACKTYINGENSMPRIAKSLHVAKSTVSRWLHLYRTEGFDALHTHETNRIYSAKLKLNAVTEYLSGKVSLQDLCDKYKIRSVKQLCDWIRKYNSHERFRPQSGGSRNMAKHKKITQQERQEIVDYCLQHDMNYGEVALKYQVAYQQVYQWVKKYKKMGSSGLEDRRGRRAGTMPSRTPEEELRDEVARLKRQNHWLALENAVLKNWTSWKEGMPWLYTSSQRI